MACLAVLDRLMRKTSTDYRLCLIDMSVTTVCILLLLKFAMLRFGVNDACDELFGKHDYGIQSPNNTIMGFRG